MTSRNTSEHDMQTLAQNSSILDECMEVRFSQMEYLPWSNPENIISAKIETYIRRITDVLIGCLFLIGGPTNVINMAVFYRQGLKDRVNLCLFSLSFTDGLYLTAATFLHAENIYLQFRGDGIIPPANKFMANNNLIVFMGLCFVSFVQVAIIACERCYCVFSPLKYQTLLKTKTMAFIIIAVYLLVFCPFFIVAFRYRIGCIHDPETGVVLQAMVVGTFYRNHKDVIDFLDSVVFGAGFPGGAMLVALTATILTTVKLRQAVSWRSETSSSLSPWEVALTKMLIGSSVFFVICISPSCVFRVVSLFLPEMRVGGRHHNFYNATLWILSGFTFINSTFNFFVYYMMGSRFRETFWGMFCGNMNQTKLKGRNMNKKIGEEADGSSTPGKDLTIS